MKPLQKGFPGSQEDMYAVASLAWQNCNEHINQFQGFRVKYTPAYVTASLQAITAAKAMHNADVRHGLLTAKRAALQAAAAESASL